MAFPNMKETDPLVVEVPPGAVAGGITDFWQRPLTDCGQTGPDKGKGGKFLVLGPDDPDLKPEGSFVLRSPTVNIWSGHRALDPDPVKAKATAAALRIYPYSQRDNPPPTRHVTPNGRKWTGEQPRGLAYWENLGGPKPVSCPLPGPAVSPAGASPGWPESTSAPRAGPARAGADSGRRG